MNEQMLRRIEKLDGLRSTGVQVYPERYSINVDLLDASLLEDGANGVRVAGRIMGIRSFSKLCFLTISNVEGRLQLLLKREEIGEALFAQFHQSIDIGDFI